MRARLFMLASVWGVGAELGSHEHQRLFAELQGIGMPAKAIVAVGQADRARQRVWVLGTEFLAIDPVGPLGPDRLRV